MNSEKVATFITLAGQRIAKSPETLTPADRALGAQLLLSEVLEYVIKGLGVIPVVDGHRIEKPDGLKYEASPTTNTKEMLDGLCDVAYTMYWNALRFGLPLEVGFDRVCDNNLEKFVRTSLPVSTELPQDQWHCGVGVSWPKEVAKVAVIEVAGQRYGVGTDASGKVRKPSSYKPVELGDLVAA